MESKVEITEFKLLLAWTAAFFLIEPFFLYAGYWYSLTGSQSMYQKYNGLSPLMIALSEYLYFTNILINACWFYKRILNKPDIFPQKGNDRDWVDFIISYVCLHLVIDNLWDMLVRVGTRVPALNFTGKYTRGEELFGPLMYGVILLWITNFVLQYFGDLESIAGILSSVFFLVAVSF